MFNRLLPATLVLGAVVAVGTVGYHWLGEGRWTWDECLYTTIITLSTVGSSELPGMREVPFCRAWTVGLIVFGSGSLVYFVSMLTAVVLEGDLTDALRRNRMEKALDALQAMSAPRCRVIRSGVLMTFGSFQAAPNLLFQRPIVGPTPAIADGYDASNGMYYAGVTPRNYLTDPFVVLDNRETVGGELLFVYDPTPATWYWMWDRDKREDADFAASLDLVYRHQPTSRDATLVILADGSQVPSAAAPPAHDVWNATLS